MTRLGTRVPNGSKIFCDAKTKREANRDPPTTVLTSPDAKPSHAPANAEAIVLPEIAHPSFLYDKNAAIVYQSLIPTLRDQECLIQPKSAAAIQRPCFF